MEKAELLNAMRALRAAWEVVLEELGPEGLEQAGATGNWRVRDVLAHCNGWERWQMVQTRCAFSGETPSNEELTGGIDYPPNDDMHPDAMNAMFIAGTRDLPAAEILRHFRDIAAMRIDWTAAATQDQLDAVIGADWKSETNRVMRLAAEVPSVSDPAPTWHSLHRAVEHQQEHLAIVQAWMARKSLTLA